MSFPPMPAIARRARLLLLAGLLALASVFALGGGAAGGDESLAPDERTALSHPIAERSLVKVAFHNLGGFGFNGNLALHGDYAYVGSWGTTGACPARGVRVLDISDHTAPVLVRTLAIPSATRASEPRVASISTASFEGDLLVNSNEACAPGGSNGVQLWDVTDPASAVQLSRFNTGVVHNMFLYQKDDRAYLLLAVPFAEVFGPGGGFPASDLQVIDVTNPASPSLVGQWTIGRDGGYAFGSPFFGNPSLPPGSNCAPPPDTPPLCRGDLPYVYLHDVWVRSDGAVAYLSYWDAGLAILDISDPTDPALVSVTPGSSSEEGNTHSAVPSEAAGLVITGDEDFAPGPWGFIRVFDVSDLANPAQVGTFATPNALAVPPPDGGWYSVHHPMVGPDGLVYAGWYADGVRVLDITHPYAPEEVASFVPPDVPDPNGELPPKAAVWAAHVHHDAVFASDMNGGLYILGYDSDLDGCADIQETGQVASRGGLRDPAYFWDFFDVWTGSPAARDRAITAGDIAAIVARFGAVRGSPPTKEEALGEARTPPPAAPAYHAAFDRGPPLAGQDVWDLEPPDGAISVGDISAIVAQFGHTCA